MQVATAGAGRVGSHAHHNLSDQECLAETLLENTAYDGMSPRWLSASAHNLLGARVTGKMLQLFSTVPPSHLATTHICTIVTWRRLTRSPVPVAR
jgi:hypothetical protein